MIVGSGGRGFSQSTLTRALKSRGIPNYTDSIESVGPHRLLAARNRTPEAHLQMQQWLGSSVDMALQFCEGANSTTTWSQNVQITEQICKDWANIDCRHEWAFPLCSTSEPLADTVAGKYDYEIEAIFKLIARFDRHAVIPVRPGWEFNNTTAYPWTTSGTGAVVADYIAAFQRVVTIARKVSPRFRFGWIALSSTIGLDGQVVNPEPSYPGDSFVDYIGMDFYYDASAELGLGTHIQRFVGKANADYGLVWLANFAASKNKPIAIPEWGINAEAPDYMEAMCGWLRQQNVFYSGYYNVNRDQGQFKCQLSNDQYPNAGLEFKRHYGPLTILTPSSFSSPTGVAFSAKLEANRGVKWSFASAYGPFSITTTGNTSYLIASAQSAGSRTVTLRATDARGSVSEKVVTVNFAANAVQPETAFYISRSTATPVAGYTSAVNTLVTGLKANALWDMFDGFYLYSSFAPELASCDLISIRRKGTFVGATTFASKLGVRSDGSTGYFDTKFQSNVATNRMNRDDFHWGLWSMTDLARTGSNTDAFEFGAGTTVSGSRIANGNVVGKTSMDSTVTLAGVPFPGHIMAIRDSSATERSYRRGAPARSGTSASARLPYESFKVLGARIADGQFGANDIALAHFGRGVGWTDEKVSTLHTLLQNFRNTVMGL